MREMKFRCWDSDNNRWMDEEGNAIRAVFTLENKTYLKWTQWTGLSDNNGVEIYEGDIVSYSDYYIGDFDIPSGKGVVEFDNGEYIVSGPEFAPKLCSEEIENEHIEIIGNIYENPELVDK